MNLDKLKALIRLANNNPSENEANLAARRVCKILADNNFTLLNPQPKTAADKVGSAKTWNDVKRSNEPAWKPSPPPPPPPKAEPFVGFDFDGIFGTNFEHFYNIHFGGRRGAKTYTQNQQKKNWTDSVPHVDAPEDNSYDRETKPKHPDDGPFYYDAKGNKRHKRRQELRVCTKCGLETMTFRVDEVPWVCNPCHWKDKI